MQDFTLQHANTFFFFTTIAVSILIIILLLVLYMVYRVFLFVRRTIAKVDILLDDVTKHTETNPIYQKAIPYILPVIAYFFGKKAKAKQTSKR